MKIIYKQGNNSNLFKNLGVSGCYFKQLFSGHDILTSTKRMHHHTFFEVHFVRTGTQKYESAGKIYTASPENMLIIPPGIKHNLIERDAGDSKLSLTFCINAESCFSAVAEKLKEPLVIGIPDFLENNLAYIPAEAGKKCMLSAMLAENRVLETIVEIMRLCGYKSHTHAIEDNNEDARLTMAKQYIKDNIETNLKLTEVAAYCYIGTKQLTRLFRQYENTTPAMYIQKERINKIIELMNTPLSLSEISEKMNFSSEYYFNAFFKKNYGMPPGVYRDTMK